MKSFSELSKNIISESVNDLDLSLSNEKIKRNTLTINETLEKEIDEIIEELLESSSIGRDNAAKGRGYGKSSSRSGSYGSTSRFSSSGSPSYGAGTTTFGRITNRRAGSRLESQNIHPTAMAKFSAFWAELKDNDYEPFVTSGQRMPSHQRDLYDSGSGHQTAQPCRSDHQYGYALDINVNLPPDEDGKVTSARMNSSDATWEPIVAIANKHGLTWQGSADRVHFYVRGMVTSAMKDACKDFYGDINVRSRGVAAAMKAKEEESPSEINNILKIA